MSVGVEVVCGGIFGLILATWFLGTLQKEGCRLNASFGCAVIFVCVVVGVLVLTAK